jgi:lipoprotein-anchoring transpeptidase ErfK/SrfK
MFKNWLTSAAVLAVLGAGSFGLAGFDAARAGTLGYPPPPVVLSPDMADPWIEQLRPSTYRAVVNTPPVPVYRHEPPVGLWQGAPQPAPALAQPRLVPLNPQSDGSQHMASVQPRAPEGQRLAAEFLPTEVEYAGPQKPGTIIIDTNERHLYLVEPDGKARRYGVGVGRPGFEWAGEHTVTRKAEWPDWTPPEAMLKRQPNLPRHMEGGPSNPLGARALYLGSTEYRIHGTSEPWTIGHAVSSGCIRMRNEDVTDLYERVKVGTKVIVM